MKSKNEIARNYIKKHPSWTYKFFVEQTGNKEKLKSKDWSNAKYRLKKGKKYLSDNIYQGFRISNKHPIASKYIIDNPSYTYDDYIKSHTAIDITFLTFDHLKSKYSKIKYLCENINKKQSKPKFKPTLMQVISEINLPDITNKTEILKWLDTEFIQTINTSQSSFKYSLSRKLYEDDKLELRLHTSK